MPADMKMKYTELPDFAEVEGEVEGCKTCRLANMKAMYYGDPYCLAPKKTIKDGKCSARKSIPKK